MGKSFVLIKYNSYKNGMTSGSKNETSRKMMFEFWCLVFIRSRCFVIKDKLKTYCCNVIRYSRLRLWVGFIYFYLTRALFYLMFLMDVLKLNLLRIEKNWHSPNFDFLSLKSLSLGQFLESSNWRRYDWTLKRLVTT